MPAIRLSFFAFLQYFANDFTTRTTKSKKLTIHLSLFITQISCFVNSAKKMKYEILWHFAWMLTLTQNGVKCKKMTKKWRAIPCSALHTYRKTTMKCKLLEVCWGFFVLFHMVCETGFSHFVFRAISRRRAVFVGNVEGILWNTVEMSTVKKKIVRNAVTV